MASGFSSVGESGCAKVDISGAVEGLVDEFIEPEAGKEPQVEEDGLRGSSGRSSDTKGSGSERDDVFVEEFGDCTFGVVAFDSRSRSSIVVEGALVSSALSFHSSQLAALSGGLSSVVNLSTSRAPSPDISCPVISTISFLASAPADTGLLSLSLSICKSSPPSVCIISSSTFRLHLNQSLSQTLHPRPHSSSSGSTTASSSCVPFSDDQRLLFLLRFHHFLVPAPLLPGTSGYGTVLKPGWFGGRCRKPHERIQKERTLATRLNSGRSGIAICFVISRRD